MNTIRTGVIGVSEGNGHPYSFSAIINGYDSTKMVHSSYPSIIKYLSLRKKNEFGIGQMKVTHIWAPDKKIAKHVAESTFIDTVTDHYTEMTETTDAILILRDDPESHREIASHFLEQGKWVFVDKPLSTNLEDLKYFLPWIKKGKLMSCSGFRYYPDILSKMDGKLNPDHIVFSHSVSIINWFKYGIHVLEGITPLMGSDVMWVQNTGEEDNHIVRIQYRDEKFALIQVNKKLGFILSSSFYTVSGNHHTIQYDDNFTCFRNTLLAFYQQIKTGKPAIKPDETETIIKILVAGNRSLRNGGSKVNIKNL